MSDLTDVISAHRSIERRSISGAAKCLCGWEQVVMLGADVKRAHAAHVATEIRRSFGVVELPELIDSPEFPLVNKQAFEDVADLDGSGELTTVWIVELLRSGLIEAYTPTAPLTVGAAGRYAAALLAAVKEAEARG